MKRKKEIDQTIKDLEVLKETNQELKKKLDGARCRIRNLECDAVTIRQKMQTFVEKSNHDDLLINEQRVSSISWNKVIFIYLILTFIGILVKMKSRTNSVTFII